MTFEFMLNVCMEFLRSRLQELCTMKTIKVLWQMLLETNATYMRNHNCMDSKTMLRH